MLFREDADMDDLIDVIEGNRRYTRCLYVYNKIDVCSIEEVCGRSLRVSLCAALRSLKFALQG